ncbi:hypothetical protein TorRG33x02_083500 [Trema orientale]|uniref:Uncharacterized protein n=1 Tax=Trema orientale TaxID=63057 RepID=A0A2P5FDG5_TREOI|nr:hypothetical protein TorRG33x02_083500 [Trema orientale]
MPKRSDVLVLSWSLMSHVQFKARDSFHSSLFAFLLGLFSVHVPLPFWVILSMKEIAPLCGVIIGNGVSYCESDWFSVDGDL